MGLILLKFLIGFSRDTQMFRHSNPQVSLSLSNVGGIAVTELKCIICNVIQSLFFKYIIMRTNSFCLYNAIIAL